MAKTLPVGQQSLGGSVDTVQFMPNDDVYKI